MSHQMSLTMIVLVLIQVTGNESWQIQCLDLREMLVEFQQDAPMGQMRDSISDLEYWLGMESKIQCEVLDQEQLWVL